MRIDILTVVPELLTSPLNESILHRAQEKGLVRIVVHNLHDYAHDRRKTTDDYPFGGEAGMVLKCEPVFELVEKLQSERHYDEIIYTSPDGIRYDQHEANRLSTLENIIILCGHYKGIDHRIREHLVTREISIGDYVLTGGELAACIIADSVVRIIPGAIGDEASALTDSFQDNLLAAAQAYNNSVEWHEEANVNVYSRRRQLAEEIMKVLGCSFDPNQVGMFLWGRIPESYNDVEELTEKVLHEARVFITPGFIFGSNGKRYIRISLCAKEEKLAEALERIKKIM